MDCRISIAHKPRARLDIKLHDVILTKEQSVLAKIKCLFKVENMKPQHRTLGWKTDLYFHGNKLENENGDTDTDIDYEMKRQKAIEQKLGCKFNRIDPQKEDFDIIKKKKNSDSKNFTEIIKIRF